MSVRLPIQSSWVLFLLLVAIWSLPLRAEGGRYHVFIPTQKRNPHVNEKSGQLDRFDPNYLELANVDRDEARRTTEELRKTPGLLTDQPYVQVVLPSGLSAEEEKRAREDAERTAREMFPQANPKLKFRTMDNVAPETIAQAAEANIDELERKLPDTPENREGIRKMREAAAEAKSLLGQLRDWVKSWGPGHMARLDNTPKGLKKLFYYLAGARGAFTAYGRLSAAATGLVSGNPAQIAAAVGLGAFDSALEFYGAAFEVGLNQRFVGSPLKVDAAKHPFLAKLAEFYPTARGVTLNTALWGIIRPTEAALFLHAADPTKHLPTLGDYGSWIGASLITSAFAVKGFGAAEKLRQMHLLNGRNAKLLVRGPGLLWPAVTLAGAYISASGNESLKPLIAVLPSPIWAAWGGAYLASLLASPRANEVILVDSRVDNRPELDALFALEHTQKVPGTSAEHLASAARTAAAAPDLTRGLYARAKSALKGCLGAWTRLPPGSGSGSGIDFENLSLIR